MRIMASGPLRQRRLDYVQSTPLIAEDGKTHYHVNLSEKPGHPPLTWIEMATQRDFTIGINVGSLIVLSLVSVTGGVGLLTSALVMGGCALLGGASDFLRNNHELEHGAEVVPPSHFNRDTVKSALSWGFIAKMAVILTGIAAATMGLPIPGADALAAAWNGAASGGLLHQIGAVALAIPNVIAFGAFAIGGAFGGALGAGSGYERMRQEYEAAREKHHNPAKVVDIAAEPAMTLWEALINIIAPTVTSGLAAEVVNTVSALKTETDAVKDHVERSAAIEASKEEAPAMEATAISSLPASSVPTLPGTLVGFAHISGKATAPATAPLTPSAA